MELQIEIVGNNNEMAQKITINIIDFFGNDTMKVIEVEI